MNENEEKRTILIDVISIVYRFACVSRAFAHIRHLHTHTHRRQQLTFYHNYSVWHTFVIDIIHLIMIEYFDINVCASVACIHISSSLFGARAVRIMQNICYNNCLNVASSFFFLLYAVCLLHHRRLLPLSQSIVQCERVIWLNECIPIGSLEGEEKTNKQMQTHDRLVAESTHQQCYFFLFIFFSSWFIHIRFHIGIVGVGSLIFFFMLLSAVIAFTAHINTKTTLEHGKNPEWSHSQMQK